MNALVADLPIGYYRDNFVFLLKFVVDRYADLLNQTESDYAARFEGLSLPAQRLYVRLALRKGPLFRSDKIAYAEIPQRDAAIEELIRCGFLDGGVDEDLDILLKLLLKSELLRLRPSCHGLNREALLAELVPTVSRDEFFTSIDFQVYRPRHLDTLRVFRLLFFGNLHQNFTEFVLNDLGIQPYENYAIDRLSRFFDRREKIEQALALGSLGEQADAWILAKDIEGLRSYQALLPVGLDPGLQRRLDKMNNRVARQLERQQAHEAALSLYQHTASGAARERSARILAAHLGWVDAAMSLCERILAAPAHEAEFEFAVGFAARLQKKVESRNRPELPVLPLPDYPVQRLSLDRQPGKRVELAVVEDFECAGDQAYYVENSLFNGIFGLAYWDIIFAPVQGVFFHPFQRGPADLYTPAFASARTKALQLRRQELGSVADLRARVLAVAEQKAGLANPFVSWGYISVELFECCFERIPIGHFQAIFDRLLVDPHANRSGFPDLIIFPASGSYLLAEVKGPNDKLQANQIRWLRYFAAAQIPHRLVNVEWH